MSDLQIKEDYQNSEPIAEQPDLQPKGIHQIIWDEDQVRKFFQIHMAEFMRLKNTDYTLYYTKSLKRYYINTTSDHPIFLYNRCLPFPTTDTCIYF
mgnify:CR=1 FL=1